MRKKDFDSKILIYKNRRTALATALAIMTAFFTVLLFSAEKNDVSWQALILPISGLGLIFLIFPPTEEWVYQPWQSKPRKVEQYNERS